MIVVLGAGGQLGSDLVRHLGNDALPLTHADADLTVPDSVRSALAGRRPRAVINCAAYNFVDRAEREPDQAFAANALGVHHLACICRDLDTVLVHLSTDYVFGQDRDRRTPFRETDAPAPTCVYGASKLAGEYLARLYPRSFVIRTCGLYGLAGRRSQKGNFIEMILRQVEQNKPLRVVDDQRCTPTASADLARAIGPLLETGRYGSYHLTNAGDCTWHEFARAVLEFSGIDRQIEAVTTDFFAPPARRPAYSVLANDAAESLGIRLRPWREALADYLSQRRSNP